MEDVSVVIENLTGEEFILVSSHLQHGKPTDGCPPSKFGRSAHLRWLADGSCVGAVEFASSPTEGTEAKKCFLRFAFDLPANPKFAGIRVGRIKGAFTGNKVQQRFSATVSNEPAENLQSFTADAPPLIEGQQNGCSVSILSQGGGHFHLRLRLLPPSGTVVGPSKEELEDMAAYVPPQADEKELNRLHEYSKERMKLHVEGGELHDKVKCQPVDPTRLHVLSPKLQIDLASALLASLFESHQRALRLAGGGKINDVTPLTNTGGWWNTGSGEAPIDPGAPGGVFELALRQNITTYYKAMVPLLGISEERVATKMSELVDQYLGQRGQEQTAMDPMEMVDCVQTFLAAVQSCGTSSGAEDGSNISPSWLLGRELLALSLCGGEGTFCARSRVALFQLLNELSVPSDLAERWELQVGGALFEVLETSKVLEQQKKENKGTKWKVGAAAVGGGALLAITGGLAAPAVAMGLASLGGAAASAGAAVGLGTVGSIVGGTLLIGGVAIMWMGPVGAAALFGATGAGLTGWKLSKRWGDLEEFEFVAINEGTEMVESEVKCNKETLPLLDAALKEGEGEIKEDLVLPPVQEGLPEAVINKGAHETLRKCDDNGVTIVSLERQRPKMLRAVSLVIFVPGFIRPEQDDFTDVWAGPALTFFPNSGHFGLKWETEQLKQLGNLMTTMVKEELAKGAAGYFFKSSVAAVSVTAAAVVAWPIWIVSSMASLDNLWLVVAQRATLAGKCLAQAIADKQCVGQRPITLVGHSMGARLIMSCLEELYAMGAFHVVHDVILLGTPVTTKKEKWRKARAVVSGRLVNGYLKSDWLLAFLYRYLEWGISVAGLSEVDVAGVESVDLSLLGIKSHDEYDRHFPDILAKVRAGEWFVAPTTPEDTAVVAVDPTVMLCNTCGGSGKTGLFGARGFGLMGKQCPECKGTGRAPTSTAVPSGHGGYPAR